MSARWCVHVEVSSQLEVSCVQAVTTKMSRIHAIMNGTAPLHSLQHEKGHLLANSPSAASLSRRLSQVGDAPHAI